MPVGPNSATTVISDTRRSMAACRAQVVWTTAMGIRIGTGLSTHPDPRVGAMEAAATARAGLGDRACDLAVVFASGAHLAAPEATLEGLHEALEPEALVGCAAGGVIAESREVEGGTAVSVWAAALDGGSVTPFHAQVEPVGDGEGVLSGLPELTGAAGAVLLADPFTFPADPVLRQLSEASPMVALLGGLASAARRRTRRRCSTATRCGRTAPSAFASTAWRSCRACR